MALRAVLIMLLALAVASPGGAAGTFTSGRHEGRGYALFTPATPAAGPPAVARCGPGPGGPRRGRGGPGGAPGGAASACLRPAGVKVLTLRASLWQGDADAVVNPTNLSALETMLARALGTAGATTEPAEGAVHTVHRDARNKIMLETWLVPGMGHAWSGGRRRGHDTYPAGPPAS